MTAMYRLYKEDVANPVLFTPQRRASYSSVVHVYSTAASVLLKKSSIFKEGDWKRGELYRLFSPLSFTMDFVTHPLGLAPSLQDGAKRAKQAAKKGNTDEVNMHGLVLRTFIDMVKPVMMLNRVLTFDLLTVQDFPDIQLLLKSVLKKEMVVKTITVLCQIIGDGAAGGYVSKGSLPWRLFLEAWHEFYGEGCTELLDACADAAMTMGIQSAVHLLLFAIEDLETQIQDGIERQRNSGAEPTAKGFVELFKPILHFTFLWSSTITFGLKRNRQETNSNALDLPPESRPSPMDLCRIISGCLNTTTISNQKPSQKVISLLKAAKTLEKIETTRDTCSKVAKWPGNGLSGDGLSAATMVASLSSLILAIRSFPMKGQDTTLEDILYETNVVTEAFMVLVDQVFQTLEESPEECLNPMLLNRFKVFSKAFSCSLDLARYAFALEVKGNADMIVPCFKALECLFTTRGKLQGSTLCKMAGYQETFLTMLAAIEGYDYILTLFIDCLLPRLKRNNLEIDDQLRVKSAGLKFVQAACKTSMLAMKDLYWDHIRVVDMNLESPKMDINIGRTVCMKITSSHRALLVFSRCRPTDRIEGAEDPEVLQFDNICTALLLQMLKGMDHFIEKMEPYLSGAFLSRIMHFSELVELCQKLLPRVALGPEPGLDRLISFAVIVGEPYGGSQTPDDIVNLIEELKSKKINSAEKNEILTRRAKALSHLQCANLDCTSVMCPWESRKPRVCSACKMARYCSEECQKGDWKAHKRGCRLIAAEG